MRQRTTWTRTPRSASTQRRADDLYTMNRDGGNPQPAVNEYEYESGGPSAWAEDVNSGSSVEKEYAGGAVKRNEINFPEFRDDTWGHAGTRPWGKGGQYDNSRLAAAQRKAAACERVARVLLRTTDEKLIEETAFDLMHLPAKALVATLKRLDQVSPASLPENSRYRRALACTKLSALILGETAEESAVERLASLFNSIDDPTLKGILSVVAFHRVAEDKEEEKKEEEPKETTSAEKCSAEGESEEEEGESEEEEGEGEGEGVLTEADLDKLKSMMEEVVETVELAEAKAEGEDVEDLEKLFEGGAVEPAPPGEAASGAPPVEITFDEGEEETTGAVSMASDLNGLFDTEENFAQREIMAAQSVNFSPRTASSKGAKKLGNVQALKPASIDASLESLWERP